MAIMSKLTAAWVAGFLDGEGCLTIYQADKNRPEKYKDGFTWTPIIRVAGTDKKTIYWFCNSFGGRVSIRKWPKENRKIAYEWDLRKWGNIEKFLKAVKPYMKTKKPQAEILLDFVKTFTGSRHKLTPAIRDKRIRLYNKIKPLNKRGIE